MKHKVLLFFIFSILLSSSFSSAYTNITDIPLSEIEERPYWIVLPNDSRITLSDQPFLYVDPGKIYQKGNIKHFNYNGTTSELVKSSYTLFTNLSNITSSSHDIYDSNGTVFFKLPIPPIPTALAMAGALQKLLSTILPNLPIILGMLVLAIGLRKAYRMLSVSLKGA